MLLCHIAQIHLSVSVDGLDIQVFLEEKMLFLDILILLICIVQMKPFHKVYFQCLPEFLVLLFVIQLE